MATFSTTGSDTYPAGIILQVVSEKNSDAGNHNNTGWATKANPSPTLETKGLNSKIYIVGHSYIHGGSVTNEVKVSFQRIITGGATTNNISTETYGFGRLATVDYAEMITISYLDSPGVAVGTDLTYKFQFGNASGSTTCYFGSANTDAVITIMEIKV